MKQYLIFQRIDQSVILRFNASSDVEALKKGMTFLLSLGLTKTQIKNNFKIGELV